MVSEDQLPSPASRALTLEHARAIAEQADRHAVTLESLLAMLRSTRLAADSPNEATSGYVREGVY